MESESKSSKELTSVHAFDSSKAKEIKGDSKDSLDMLKGLGVSDDFWKVLDSSKKLLALSNIPPAYALKEPAWKDSVRNSVNTLSSSSSSITKNVASSSSPDPSFKPNRIDLSMLPTMVEGIGKTFTKLFSSSLTSNAYGTGSAIVSTDQHHYSGGATATISGTGFISGTTITIYIQRPDSNVDILITQSDGSGSFSVNYTTPTINGIYQVDATDGTNAGSTHFSTADAEAQTLDQCRNGGVNKTPVNCTGSAWSNGNAGAQDSHYVEGGSIIYRAIFTGLMVGATYTVRDGYHTEQTGNAAIGYITHPAFLHNPNVTVDPCSGLNISGVTSCPVDVGSNPGMSTLDVRAVSASRYRSQKIHDVHNDGWWLS